MALFRNDTQHVPNHAIKNTFFLSKQCGECGQSTRNGKKTLQTLSFFGEVSYGMEP